MIAGLMRACRSRAMLATMLGISLVSSYAATRAHPPHTTLAELTYSSTDRTVHISVRVFADDFATVVSRHSRVKAAQDHSVPDSAASAYVRTAFALTDRGGHELSLRWCGSKRSAELLWLCLRVPSPDGVRGLRLRDELLFELFDDQINLVQTSSKGRRKVLLFTKGDSRKLLE